MEKEQIRNLLSMFEGKYEDNAKYISIEGKIGELRAVMEQQPDIFYFASKTRVILVRWICMEIRRIFERYNYNNISLSTEAYDEIRRKMQTKALNRTTLCEMFGCSTTQMLDYASFQKYEERYLGIYNMYAPTTKTKKSEKKNLKPVNIFNELNEILSENREQEVLMARSNGITLDMIGEKLDVTRERARQIEVKPRHKIRRWLENRTKEILEKVCENNAISAEKITDAIGEKKWKIVKYVVSAEKGNYKWAYIKSIDMVIYDEDGKFDETAKSILKNSKKKNNSISIFVEEMNNRGYRFVTEEIARKYFKSNNFNTFGEDVYEGKMTIGKASIIAVDKYYPNGIQLSDKDEVSKFAEIINNEYNLKVKPDRALLTRMQDVLIMCGKATYCSPNQISISSKLLDKVTKYIHSLEEDRISYSVLFEKFKTELEKENINNQYALHGLLKANEYPCGILCLKHYVCKNEIESTLSKSYFKDFEQWLLKKGTPVSGTDILKKYDKWTRANIKYAMSYYKNIVQWEGDFYFNVNCINIDFNVKEKLSEILANLTNNKHKYTSSYVLYQSVQKTLKDFLTANKIENEKQLYYVVQNAFSDNYIFRCPHISADLTKTTFSTEDLVRLVTGNKTKINKQEITEALGKYYGNKNSSLSLAIQKHLLEYIRIGTYEYYRKDKIKLTDSDKKAIEDFIKSNMIQGEVFLPNKKMDYSKLPDISCGWNPWVICEMIDLLSLDLKKIEKKNTPSQNNMTVILSADSKLKTKDAVLRWLINHDYSAQRDKTVFAYAKQTGMYHTNLTSEEVNQKLNN